AGTVAGFMVFPLALTIGASFRGRRSGTLMVVSGTRRSSTPPEAPRKTHASPIIREGMGQHIELKSV
ncbi:MAG: hypothetical protein B7Y61_17235, partial [Rhizobiales bacterium 35-66-30]